MRFLSLLALLLLPLTAAAQPPKATPGNRLAYLDELDPYYPHAKFPKLITPQWVGEEGVEAVVILAIDDMRDPKKYETYLRPILNRLKKIDGRAPVSIMTCSVDPKDPQLQGWLKEGLSLECHTVDHPCPFFKPGFDKAKDTYDRCVDLMNSIPGNKPVAFRMPCCDSLNTPSPRHWAEIFDQQTHEGNSLSIDSSVFMLYTSDDPELPKELVLENGVERFKKYLPADREFVNWIENYPYPYRIGKFCWQFPCMMPSDWVAQHRHKPNNPLTVRDWKAALDCTVIKKGVFTMVFHPHGWIKAEQIVELIDHAVDKYGKKVKFLTFKEAHDRLQTAFFRGVSWREAAEAIQFLDVNNDGYLDRVIQNGNIRIWNPRTNDWGTLKCEFTNGARFGVLNKNGLASFELFGMDFGMGGTFSRPIRSYSKLAHFDGAMIRTEQLDKQIEWTIPMRLIDLDGDGICEKIDYNGDVYAYKSGLTWHKLPFKLPLSAMLFLDEPQGFRDSRPAPCFRLVDLNGDGKLDLVFSNAWGYGVYLFVDKQTGWKEVRSGKASDKNAIPIMSWTGKNNGCFVHSGHLYWANEDTVLLRNHVDKRSFKELLQAPP